MNASSATAAASPMPNSAMSREPMNEKVRNTQIMIVAAAVMTRAVSTSSRKLSPTMAKMNQGSFASTTLAKSAKVAVTPPMYTWSVVPRSAAGMVLLRKAVMRSDVAFASGEVAGVTWMTSVPLVAASVLTLVTSPTRGRPASSVRSATASAGERVCATSSSGPLKPGPKPSASRSYACRVVLAYQAGLPGAHVPGR